MPQYASATGTSTPLRRLGPAFVASLVGHGLLVGLAVLVLRHVEPASDRRPPDIRPAPPEIVWLQEPGPGGGGGGGGNRLQPPPRRAEAAGRDALTVRVSRRPALEPREVTPVPEPDDGLDIPAQRLASGLASLPGAIQAVPGPPTSSQGSGSDEGAGDGSRGGDGPGAGRGLGDGRDRNSGGKIYGLGDGVAPPVPLYRGTPAYTAEAMRARIEGSVVVACVVQPNGTCTDIKITRSLDAAFGLDQEAVKAARRWRFRPGTRTGEPVPVLVTIELAFSIR